jgi:hypothetical protein
VAGGAFAISLGAVISDQVRIDASGGLAALDYPSGSTAWWGGVQAVFFPAVAVCWLAWLTGQVLSFRRSSGDRRLQLKWLLSGVWVGLGGLEPPTSSLSGKRSNRLSYRPAGARGEANSRAGLGYRKPGLAAQSDSFSVTSTPPVIIVTRLKSTAPIVARAVIRTMLIAPISIV